MGRTADFPFDIEAVVQLIGLNIRRVCQGGVYTDCPFCGDKRGKLKVNYIKNVWRCNYCNESGGILQLYAKSRGISTREAYRDICDALQNGLVLARQALVNDGKARKPENIESERVDPHVIHATYSALLDLLKLTKSHREHLRAVRGLSDDEIDRLGFKSTPPFYLCNTLAERLIGLGYTVSGVPGFYQRNGKWTVNFSSFTDGILLPAKDPDGKISGFQIRLDVPIKYERDTGEKTGTKYVWFSSSGKMGGCSPGSPIHFIGDSNAQTVYVTEGVLKADISHCLTGRTFAAIAGANNLTPLDALFRRLSANGTRLIIEAHDMDKYRNNMVDKGAAAISRLAKKYGMDCKRLTWNPNYKGFDDWQLALRRKKRAGSEVQMNFRERFIHGLCDIDTIDDEITAWNEASEHSMELPEYLGLSKEEYSVCTEQGNTALEARLRAMQEEQLFKVYQLDFGEDDQPKSFAFGGIETLHKAGYEQPPAAEYRLVHCGKILCGKNEPPSKRLDFIFRLYNDNLPADYKGRSISPSDVVELYSDAERKYYYCDTKSFCEVRFSPFMTKPMKTG